MITDLSVMLCNVLVDDDGESVKESKQLLPDKKIKHLIHITHSHMCFYVQLRFNCVYCKTSHVDYLP